MRKPPSAERIHTKRALFILAGLLFLAGGGVRWAVAHHSRAAGEQDSLKVGSPAPTFVMRNIISGEPVFLRDFAGTTLRRASRNRPKQVVVLSFWATWCEPCKKEIPLLMKMADAYAGKPVQFFLVNTLEQSKEPTHTEDSVKAALQTRGYTLPCMVDATGRVADSYRVRSLPVLVVIDKDGIIRRINRGYEEGFESGLRTLLNELAGG